MKEFLNLKRESELAKAEIQKAKKEGRSEAPKKILLKIMNKN